ncbi:MoaD/ThiS family protein [Dehalococcoidia bacterium]|nr:MoaD/ThiS family protein [Dehalococcoidia bacterium]MCL0049001.1 MoaD/ThiS family protein [Dehalococcoidia bacterium]MCL0082625.1 MoaD/ThiS family protein [Dehalococcoidia bacterium]
MIIEIRLYATLKSYRPELKVGEPLFLNVDEGTTAKRVLEEVLGIPAKVIKTVFVNGIYRDLDHVLADGDRVGIFPPVGGG